MKLSEIEVGQTYTINLDAPTDQEQSFLGLAVGVADVRGVLAGGRVLSPKPSPEVEVVAVRVPYKKGRHGVTVQGVRSEPVVCRCHCGDEHQATVPVESHPEHLPGEYFQEPVFEDVPVEFTVHFTALRSVGELAERFLERREWMIEAAAKRPDSPVVQGWRKQGLIP